MFTMFSSKKGFTVIELIMVILIVAILAVVVAPRITALYPIKLSGAAEKLASDLRYAQNLAMSKHIDHRIAFDITAETYAVYCYNADTDSWDLVKDPLKRGDDFIVDYTDDSRYQGIEIVSTSFLSATVEFDSTLGKPSSGGEVVLHCRETSTHVIVTANTGKVSIE